MAYIYDPEQNPSFTVVRDDHRGYNAVEFGIGRDNERNAIFIMRVLLIDSYPFAPPVEQKWRLWYGPICIDATSREDQSQISFERDLKKELIPVDARRGVLSRVLYATKTLIDVIRPFNIWRSTHYPNLDFTGLIKYFLMSEVIAHAGYRTVEIEEHDGGKGYWLHQRIELC